MKHVTYMDYAAATPVDPSVLKAMQPFYAERFFNPSALYLAAQDVAKSLGHAREEVASILGAKPAEIIFTAGGTEANNLAIAGIMQQYPDAHMVMSSIEHDSVVMPAQEFSHSEVKVQPNGRLDHGDIERQITENTVLISIMYANNEIGTIQPIREVAKLVKEIRKNRQRKNNKLPLFLHTDACQATNYLDLHVHRLGVDLMTLNGGKIYGPKQSGVLFKAAHVNLQPQILGGGQEFGQRSGTENVVQSIGFAKALTLVQDKREKEVIRLQKLQKIFFDELEKQIPQVVINGSLKHRMPNNIHITIPGQDNERLLMSLDEQGIMCATGSACSASKEEASHVLKALGLPESAARSSLRFTLGQQTSMADVLNAVKTLQKIAT
jgi:cysteine desulfurase